MTKRQLFSLVLGVANLLVLPAWGQVDPTPACINRYTGLLRCERFQVVTSYGCLQPNTIRCADVLSLDLVRESVRSMFPQNQRWDLVVRRNGVALLEYYRPDGSREVSAQVTLSPLTLRTLARKVNALRPGPLRVPSEGTPPCMDGPSISLDSVRSDGEVIRVSETDNCVPRYLSGRLAESLREQVGEIRQQLSRARPRR